MPLNIVRFLNPRGKLVVLEFQAHGLGFKSVQGAQGTFEAGVKALDFEFEALDFGFEGYRVAFGDKSSRDKDMGFTGVRRG
jgi:hypothetical protein